MERNCKPLLDGRKVRLKKKKQLLLIPTSPPLPMIKQTRVQLVEYSSWALKISPDVETFLLFHYPKGLGRERTNSFNTLLMSTCCSH